MSEMLNLYSVDFECNYYWGLKVESDTKCNEYLVIQIGCLDENIKEMVEILSEMLT